MAQFFESPLGFGIIARRVFAAFAGIAHPAYTVHRNSQALMCLFAD